MLQAGLRDAHLRGRGGGSGPGHGQAGARGAAQSRQDRLLPDFWHLRLDTWRLTGRQAVRRKERESALVTERVQRVQGLGRQLWALTAHSQVVHAEADLLKSGRTRRSQSLSLRASAPELGQCGPHSPSEPQCLRLLLVEGPGSSAEGPTARPPHQTSCLGWTGLCHVTSGKLLPCCVSTSSSGK